MLGSPPTIRDHYYNKLQTMPTNGFMNHTVFLEKNKVNS